MSRRFAVCLVLGLGGLAAACGDRNRAAADAALASARGEYDAIAAESVEYAPDRAATVQADLAGAAELIEAGDSAEALADVQDLAPTIAELRNEIAFRKADLAGEWEVLSSTVPAALSAVQSRVEELSDAASLPEAVTSQTVDNARTSVEALDASWSEAAEAFQAGELSNAIARAREVETRAARLMADLQMEPINAPPSNGGSQP